MSISPGHRIVVAIMALVAVSAVMPYPCRAQYPVTMRTVATGYAIPWGIAASPDGLLWITERDGRISTLDPDRGVKRPLADLTESTYAINEAGLMDIMLHPDFPDTPWVYVTTVRRRGDGGDRYRAVLRLTYTGTALTDAVEIFAYRGGHEVHQGSRLQVLPDRTLLVSAGDDAWPLDAQDLDSLDGKILRINLDGSIPHDNPFPGSPVYTYGHRNPQGITLMPSGSIFAAEHGNAIDDEVNRIEAGRNYGWPLVEGPCDLESERPHCDSLNVAEPFWATGSPTAALADLVYYDHDRLPAFRHSLLVASLKNSSLYQIRLVEGQEMVDTVIRWFPFAYGRLRAVCVTPDGRLFVSTSNREPNGRAPYPLDDDDRIIEILPTSPEDTVGLRIVNDSLVVRCLPGDRVGCTIIVENTGTAPAQVDNVWLRTWPVFAGQWFTPLPLCILPGEQRPVYLQFSPTKDSVYVDDFSLSEDGRPNGFTYGTVIGTTEAGRVFAARDTVALASSPAIGVSDTISIVHRGTLPVTITAFDIAGEAAGDYTAMAELPATLRDGERLVVTVTFEPGGFGRRQATLTTVSDGYAQPVVELDGSAVVSSVDESRTNGVNTRPVTVWPNPFSTSTTIAATEGTDITITDLFGRTVWHVKATEPAVRWNGHDGSGNRVAPGIYLVHRHGGSASTTAVVYQP